MKLKYYLRGLGLGIVFTTFILMISFWSHKNDISDEEVIRRAERLGMVMKDDNSSLWNKEPDEHVTETENPPATEAEEGGEPGKTDGDDNADTSDKPGTSDEAGAAQEPSKKPKASDSQSSEADTKVTIKIAKGDACRIVAEKLMAKGLIEDSEDFRQYMDEKNLDSKLKVGKFSIPKNSTYDQIAKIIAN